MTGYKLPEGFTLASDRTPHNADPVEVIYEPSPTARHFENGVAYHDTEYRPRNPWQTLDNNAVSDSGNVVLAWRSLRDEMRIIRL